MDVENIRQSEETAPPTVDTSASPAPDEGASKPISTDVKKDASPAAIPPEDVTNDISKGMIDPWKIVDYTNAFDLPRFRVSRGHRPAAYQ